MIARHTVFIRLRWQFLLPLLLLPERLLPRWRCLAFCP
jgi:hypothetical protein